MAQLLLASSSLTAATPASMAEALARVEARLDAWAANTTAYNNLLLQVFAAAGTEPALWQQAAAALNSMLQSSGLAIGLELLSNAELPGINGAYTAHAPGGGERLYLNSAWLQTATTAQIEAVLLEELGHVIDRRLNGSADSPGDEGERFSALLRGQQPTAASLSENDQRTLILDGQAVLMEAADTTAPVALTTTPAYATATTNPFGLATVGAFSSPSLVDIDGDGDLDAFIGERFGNILFFRNTAAPGSSGPAFAAPTTNPFGLADVGTFASPSLIDIDGDGDLDALIGNGDGNSLLFRNTAAAGSTSPAFAASTTNPFGLADVGSVASPSFVDIDGDDDLDAFIGNTDGNTLFFRNTAAPGSTRPAYSAPTTNPFGLADGGIAASARFADIDNDGDLDALIGNSDGNTHFFRNTAAAGSTSPAFAAPTTNPFGLADVGSIASPSFVDIDGDGDLDALIGNRDGNALFFSNTAPALGLSSITANGTYGVGSKIILTLTFSEAVVVVTTGGTPSLQLETGSTDRLAYYSSGSGTSTLTFTYTVQAGDTSADLDLTSSSALLLNGGTIGDAAGNNAVLTLAAPGSPASLAARNNLVVDGIAPVALTSAPAYAAPTNNPFGLVKQSFSASPSFVDIDGDGDLDAFIGNEEGSTYSPIGNTVFFRNTAAPGSSSPAFAAPTTNPFGLAEAGGVATPSFVDVDGDGDFDALIGNKAGNTLFFRNTAAAGSSNPAFAAPSTNPFGLVGVGNYASPSFVDSDGDGDLDAFIGNKDGNTLFFRNTAATGSTSPAYSAPTTNPFGLADVSDFARPSFVDIDGDGDLDAFIGELYGNIIFFRNTAAPGSSSPAFAAPSTNPFGLVDVRNWSSPSWADIDGDGDLDAFIGQFEGNTLFFRNTAPALGLSSSNANGTYGVGAVLTLTVTFSEAVFVTGAPHLQLETGTVDRFALYTSGSGSSTLTFSYTVQAGDSSADLDLRSAIALTVNGGTIKDAAGNNAVLSLAAPGSPASLAARKALVIDGIAPLLSAGPTAATAPGVSGFSLTANEAATAALLRADNSLLFPTPLTANTSTLLTVGAQAAITASSLVVTDPAGNHTTSATRVLLGTNNADALNGSGNADLIFGFGGNDTLTGAAGVDQLVGGDGSDTYVIGTNGDLVVETNATAATGGTDMVLSSLLSYTLTANVENLTLTAGALNGTGNTLNNTINGTAAANSLNGAEGSDNLFGFGGSDTLIGAAGVDTLNGGDGSDTYVIGTNGDLVVETNTVAATGGVDTVLSSLTAYTLTANVENLTLTAGALNGTGNTLNNTITGTAAANSLNGAVGNDNLFGFGGNDTLNGGAGNDTLTGGLNADVFRFDSPLNATTNRDRITDFNIAQGDQIQLENSVFTTLTTTGTLAAAAFFSGAAATSASHRILYNNATGVLAYDSDGTGAAASIAFATLSPALALSNTSFTVT